MRITRCDRCNAEIFPKSVIGGAIEKALCYPKVDISILKNMTDEWQTLDLCEECRKNLMEWLKAE